MKWKNRLTNYNFWISICSAVLLILQALNLKFDIAYVSEIATGVLGLLVVIGIINDPTKSINSLSQIQTKEKITQQSTPINGENENRDDIDEIDFQTIINKISTDIINQTNQINIKNILSEQIKNIVNDLTQNDVKKEDNSTENLVSEKNLDNQTAEFAENENQINIDLNDNVFEEELKTNSSLEINLDDNFNNTSLEKEENNINNQNLEDLTNSTNFDEQNQINNSPFIEQDILNSTEKLIDENSPVENNSDLEENKIETKTETEICDIKPICFNIVN